MEMLKRIVADTTQRQPPTGKPQVATNATPGLLEIHEQLNLFSLMIHPAAHGQNILTVLFTSCQLIISLAKERKIKLFPNMSFIFFSLSSSLIH